MMGFKKLTTVITIFVLSSLITAFSGGALNHNITTKLLNNLNHLKAAYIDITGYTGTISSMGYAAPNILLFAFADVTKNNINSTWLTNIKTAINNEQSGAINFLSIGGEKGNAATFSAIGISTVVNNITTQINSINDQLAVNKKITGIDLDLENSGWTATMINQLAQKFKAAGFLISIAPQIYLANSTSSNIDPIKPANLGMTTAGISNIYQEAVASGNVDYIMAQTYNTGNWTVGNYSENQVQFFQAIAQALNNSVQDTCSIDSVSACIPRGTKILIGEPANGAASGNSNNIFASNGTTLYNQSTILTNLNNQWSTVQASYPNISGIMEWSLNNDFNPSGFGDLYAKIGAFTTTVFGAAAPSISTYFILQVTNTGPDQAGTNAYATATLVINNAYHIFGLNAPWAAAGQQPIAPGNANYQLWGTLASAQNPATPNVIDSSNLDTIFTNNNETFSTSSIIINGYSSYDQNVNQPNNQYTCSQGTNYTFHSGHSYNLMINAVTKTCAITQVN